MTVRLITPHRFGEGAIGSNSEEDATAREQKAWRLSPEPFPKVRNSRLPKVPEGNGLVVQLQDMASALRIRTPRQSIRACRVILAKTLLRYEGVHHESSPSTWATSYFSVLVVTEQSTYGNMDFLESWPIPAKWYLC